MYGSDSMRLDSSYDARRCQVRAVVVSLKQLDGWISEVSAVQMWAIILLRVCSGRAMVKRFQRRRARLTVHLRRIECCDRGGLPHHNPVFTSASTATDVPAKLKVVKEPMITGKKATGRVLKVSAAT